MSGKGQIGGDGFPRQRTAIAAFAGANGLDVVEESETRACRARLGSPNDPA